jgi:hypothetical protein
MFRGVQTVFRRGWGGGLTSISQPFLTSSRTFLACRYQITYPYCLIELLRKDLKVSAHLTIPFWLSHNIPKYFTSSRSLQNIDMLFCLSKLYRIRLPSFCQEILEYSNVVLSHACVVCMYIYTILILCNVHTVSIWITYAYTYVLCIFMEDAVASILYIHMYTYWWILFLLILSPIAVVACLLYIYMYRNICMSLCSVIVIYT